jgi:hypothetical protein
MWTNVCGIIRFTHAPDGFLKRELLKTMHALNAGPAGMREQLRSARFTIRESFRIGVTARTFHQATRFVAPKIVAQETARAASRPGKKIEQIFALLAL